MNKKKCFFQADVVTADSEACSLENSSLLQQALSLVSWGSAGGPALLSPVSSC